MIDKEEQQRLLQMELSLKRGTPQIAATRRVRKKRNQETGSLLPGAVVGVVVAEEEQVSPRDEKQRSSM